MATNRIQGKGLVTQYDASATHAVGTLVLIGDQGLFGWALETMASGTATSVELPSGYGPIIDISVKGHNGTSNTAVAVGDQVFHSAGDAFEADVTLAATFIGYALEAVSSGSTTTINVLLAPCNVVQT